MAIKVIKKMCAGIALLSVTFLQTAAAHDDDQQYEPVEMLINFQVTGQYTGVTSSGTPLYTINGPGYAPEEIFRSGEVSDEIDPERKVAELANAQITFTGLQNDPVLRFTCLPGSCTLTFKDGSVLQSNAGVDLEGRAANLWGPVVKSPAFDPQNGIMPIRIFGCGGLKEVAGKGRLAGMVGSICFNGVLNFNQNDPSTLTGSSKCTITMHPPADPSKIP